MRTSARIRWGFAAAVAAITALSVVASSSAFAATVEFDPDGLIDLETVVAVDSVTVGQRFTVTHAFTFPDSLSMVPVTTFSTGRCRLLSARPGVPTGETTPGMATRAFTLTLLPLELDAARVPEQAFNFTTPAGDTLRVFSRAIEIPVALVTSEESDLVPLKEQWEAPGSIMPWIAAGAAALALAVLAWWWLRRRRRAVEPDVLVPVVPADYEALTELTRIEGLGLLDKAEFKLYYTLVVDAVRHYLEKRFAVDAMDRTSDELLMILEARGVSVEDLPPLLSEADLVKFARHRPTREYGEGTMKRARAIVVETTPRTVETPADAPASRTHAANDDTPPAAEGGGGA